MTLVTNKQTNKFIIHVTKQMYICLPNKNSPQLEHGHGRGWSQRLDTLMFGLKLELLKHLLITDCVGYIFGFRLMSCQYVAEAYFSCQKKSQVHNIFTFGL